MKITICGGGSLGHVCLGVLGSQKDVEVSLLTRKPEQWQSSIRVTDNEVKTYSGHVAKISRYAEEVIPQADIVFLCLPGFAIDTTLKQISPYLSPTALVGSIVSSTGFFFSAHHILPSSTPLFGFQRVPFISRMQEYGQSAIIYGHRPVLNVAAENMENADEFRRIIERIFMTPTHLLGSFYEAALTNSNPILHTARLYAMWHQWDGVPIPACSYFYKEWDKESAQLLIDMDAEFIELLHHLPMNAEAVPPLLLYYESTDADSLAAKLRSIAAFAPILSPMKETERGWVPDFGSRYFTEDFPFGLRFVRELAHNHNLPCPTIDRVYEWGMSVAAL